MTRRADLRASDAEREHVASLLRHAATEGRLAPEELDERMGAALSARTYGELDAVLFDLPASAHLPERRSRSIARRPVMALAAATAIVMVVVFAIVSALIGSGHAGHHGFADGAPIIWLVWAIIGWRYFARRSHRAR
ncbi:MAG TPA: DUF1707 domain-containing protein [Solirubrobacteraceae bacterium]